MIKKIYDCKYLARNGDLVAHTFAASKAQAHKQFASWRKEYGYPEAMYIRDEIIGQDFEVAKKQNPEVAIRQVI